MFFMAKETKRRVRAGAGERKEVEDSSQTVCFHGPGRHKSSPAGRPPPHPGSRADPLLLNAVFITTEQVTTITDHPFLGSSEPFCRTEIGAGLWPTMLSTPKLQDHWTKRPQKDLLFSWDTRWALKIIKQRWPVEAKWTHPSPGSHLQAEGCVLSYLTLPPWAYS